jgi:hypothetical protein
VFIRIESKCVSNNLKCSLTEKSSFGGFESITTRLTLGADIFFKINFFNEKGQDHNGPALKTII